MPDLILTDHIPGVDDGVRPVGGSDPLPPGDWERVLFRVKAWAAPALASPAPPTAAAMANPVTNFFADVYVYWLFPGTRSGEPPKRLPAYPIPRSVVVVYDAGASANTSDAIGAPGPHGWPVTLTTPFIPSMPTL